MLSLLAETWTWWAFGLLIVLFRYTSRWVQLKNIKSFEPEDYIMIVVFGFYTALIVFMNEVAQLDTNLMLPGDELTLTPDSIASRIYGSKLVLVVEQCMIMTQWGCKICLLLLYNKLTMGLKQQWAVRIVGGYVVLNWILMESFYFGVWCRPFDQYWAVPVANIQCSAAIHHLITNAIFNITSDLMMLCIPLPLLITSQLPRANKIILCCLFGLGVFVILCAVLNKYYSFAHPFDPAWEFWYIREASTAVYVANIPMCWSLMRRIFKLKAFNGVTSSNGGRSRSKSRPIATSYTGAGGLATQHNGTIMTSNKSDGANNNSWWDRERGLTRSESEEHIVEDGKMNMPLEILTLREVDIDRASVDDHQSNQGHNAEVRSKKGYESRTVISTVTVGKNDSGARRN